MMTMMDRAFHALRNWLGLADASNEARSNVAAHGPVVEG
jgi:hypothetical protein